MCHRDGGGGGGDGVGEVIQVSGEHLAMLEEILMLHEAAREQEICRVKERAGLEIKIKVCDAVLPFMEDDL